MEGATRPAICRPSERAGSLRIHGQHRAIGAGDPSGGAGQSRKVGQADNGEADAEGGGFNYARRCKGHKGTKRITSPRASERRPYAADFWALR